MNALANAGQPNSKRFLELQFLVAEQEEEEEQRDQSRVSKVTQAVINHSSYSCIGSHTSLKQKTIRKLFPQSLKQLEKLNKVNAANQKETSPSRHLESASESKTLMTAMSGKQFGLGDAINDSTLTGDV